MYIISSLGFFSFARLDFPDHDALTFVIRARARRDLRNLLSAANLDLPVLHTPDRDYPWRVYADPPQLRKILLTLGGSIGKGGDLKEHPDRGDLYCTVWALLAGIRE